MHTLNIKTDRRTQLVDITNEVQSAVTKSGTKTGICYLYVPHTTAAITINEHADPDVARDVEGDLRSPDPRTRSLQAQRGQFRFPHESHPGRRHAKHFHR